MQSIVECYDLIEFTKPLLMKTVPNGRIDAWVNLSGKFDFYNKKKENFYCAPISGFFPLTNKNTIVRIPKKLFSINIKFFPHLLNLKPLKLLQKSEQSMSLYDLFENKMVDEFLQAINSTNEILAKISTIETFFEQNLFNYSSKDNWLKSAIKKMEKENDFDFKIKLIASEMGLSTKTIERRFKEIIGLTPKVFFKILRFQKAIKEIKSPNKTILNKNKHISIPLGYFDQSHFIKESQALTGVAPKKLLKEFIPFSSDFLVIKSE